MTIRKEGTTEEREVSPEDFFKLPLDQREQYEVKTAEGEWVHAERFGSDGSDLNFT